MADVLYVPSQYQTIQSAITAAGAGDVISISPGTYTENVRVNKGLVTLRGSGPELTAINGQGNVVIACDTGGVVVENLSVINAGEESGVEFGYGTSVLRDSVVTGCRYGVAAYNFSSPLIESNRIMSAATCGVLADHSTSPTIANNIFTDCEAGVYVRGGSEPLVINNVMFNNPNSGVYARDFSKPDIFNNIVMGGDAGVVRVHGASVSLGWNDFYNLTTTYIGCSAGRGDLYADPQFVNAGDDNFRLRETSPCIDAGTNTGAPPFDFEDDPRPANGVVDIGVDEVATGSGRYSNAMLAGGYGAHDILAENDGDSSIGTGTRSYDGDGGYSESLTLTDTDGDTDTEFGGHLYSVHEDGTFTIDGASAAHGTVGLSGELAAVTEIVYPGAVPLLDEGMAGLRLALRRGSGLSNSTFSGTYSMHSLWVKPGGSAETALGVAYADGSGSLREQDIDGQPATYTYIVSSDGRMSVAGQSSQNATVGAYGDIVLRTRRLTPGTDIRFPEGGLVYSAYLRRGGGLSNSDFIGTYRVHGLTVAHDFQQVAELGTLTLSSGQYNGTISDSDDQRTVSGTYYVRSDGTFTLDGEDIPSGTVGATGEVAVVTRFGAEAVAGVTGEAGMQVWVRTTGDPFPGQDRDRDGLPDSQEDVNGNGIVDPGETDPLDPDTDGDGIEDGYDPYPLTPSPMLVLGTNALFFEADEMAPPPSSQTLSILNNGAGSMSWYSSVDAPWLHLDPPTGSGPTDATVIVNTVGLSHVNSPFIGTITIYSTGAAGSPVSVTVQLDLNEPGAMLRISPGSLSFNAVELHDNPDPLPFSVTNEGVGILVWQASSGSDWLTVDPISGVAPSVAQCIVDITGLRANDSPFHGAITVTAEDAVGSPRQVSVTLTLEASPPILSVSPDSLEFEMIEGEPTPEPQMIEIGNEGSGALAWAVNEDAPWLEVSQESGLGDTSVEVSVDPDGLTTAGSPYNATIYVSATGAEQSPRSVTVTFVVKEPPPVLDVTPLNLTFDAVEDGDNPPLQTLHIQNTGEGTLRWQAESDVDWLTMMPSFGEGDAETQVRADIEGLEFSGSPYQGAITVSADDAENSPVTVAITLYIEENLPRFEFDPASLSFVLPEYSGRAIETTVRVANGGPGELNWTASSEAEWLEIQPESDTTPTDVTITASSQNLSAEGSPYTADIIFDAPEAAQGPAVLPVTVEVRVPYELNESVLVNDASGEQLYPTIASNTVAGEYFVVWESRNPGGTVTIACQAIDAASGIPLGPPRNLVSGERSRGGPQAAYDPGRNEYLLVWHERIPTGSQRNIFAERVDGATYRRVGDTFLVSQSAHEQTFPFAAYDAARDTYLVTWQQSTNQPGESNIHALLLEAETMQPIGQVAELTSDQETQLRPAAVFNRVGGEYLVAWSSAGVGGFEEDIAGVRLDSANLNLKDGLIEVRSVAGEEHWPDVALNTTAHEYLVVWEEAGSHPQSADVLAQRVSCATGELVGDPIEIAAGSAAQTRPEAAFSVAGDQYIVVWGEGGGTTASIVGQRVTAAGHLLGEPLEVSDEFDGSAPSNIDLVYRVALNEMFVVWEGASRDEKDIFSARLGGGSADADDDGMPNDFEIEHGLDPFDSEGNNGGEGDIDGDGLTNAVEMAGGTLLDNADSDGDGLADGREDADRDGELDAGETSPLLADSDADGYSDGAEAAGGSNPLDLESGPDAGIYRIEFGAFAAGIEALGSPNVSVHVNIAENGDYLLTLNSDDALVAPAGWDVEDAQGSADAIEIHLERGSRAIPLKLAPETGVSRDEAIATCDFTLRIAGEQEGISTLAQTVVFDPLDPLADAEVAVLSAVPGTVNTVAELIEYFAPVLKLHSTEKYRPVPVEMGFAASRLVTAAGVLEQPVFAADVGVFPLDIAVLDASGADPEQLYSVYAATESGYSSVVYATAVRVGESSHIGTPDPQLIAIQYFYYYFVHNWGEVEPGGNTHEGDWELVVILLEPDGTPLSVTCSQQTELLRTYPTLATAGGAHRVWQDVELMVDAVTGESSHPAVYVGNGGHSGYFATGGSRYLTGIESHDGRGTWLIPTAQSGEPQVNTDYPYVLPIAAETLPRLSEAEMSRRPGHVWLKFAGLWGQRELARAPDDRPVGAGQDGCRGPVFLGDTDSTDEPLLVRSAWIDPYAWTTGKPGGPVRDFTFAATGRIAGKSGDVAVAALGRSGQIHFVPLDEVGQFALTLSGDDSYVLAVCEIYESVELDGVLAIVEYDTGDINTVILEVGREIVLSLGELHVQWAAGRAVASANPLMLLDSDGDGPPNGLDVDDDGDGVPDETDPDITGNGFRDTIEISDCDNDGVPDFFDLDDDNDGVADDHDEDRNGDGMPDEDQPPDTDGDGVIDAIDPDDDNDGFADGVEMETGSDPLNTYDSPARRVCDVNVDGSTDALDVQTVINQALGVALETRFADIDRNSQVDAIDVQRCINAALGL